MVGRGKDQTGWDQEWDSSPEKGSSPSSSSSSLPPSSPDSPSSPVSAPVPPLGPSRATLASLPRRFIYMWTNNGIRAMRRLYELDHEPVWRKLNHTRCITCADLYKTTHQVSFYLCMKGLQGNPPIGPRLHSGVEVALQPRHV